MPSGKSLISLQSWIMGQVTEDDVKPANKQTVEIESTQAFSGYNPTTERLALVTFVRALGTYFVTLVEDVGDVNECYIVKPIPLVTDALKEADAWLR